MRQQDATSHRLVFESQYGWLQNEIPAECVADCYHSGDCFDDVQYWVRKLHLTESLEPVENLARDYLREYGNWDDLDTCDLEVIAQRILWLACGDIQEHGEWFGLVH